MNGRWKRTRRRTADWRKRRRNRRTLSSSESPHSTLSSFKRVEEEAMYVTDLPACLLLGDCIWLQPRGRHKGVKTIAVMF